MTVLSYSLKFPQVFLVVDLRCRLWSGSGYRCQYLPPYQHPFLFAQTLPEEISHSSGGDSNSGLVSFLRRVFGGRKAQDVRVLLKECITETADDFNAKNARKNGFHLEEDWMNPDADVAIPWTLR